MIKGNLNVRELCRVPGVRTFSLPGLTLATDGKAMALNVYGKGFWGSVEECEKFYPSVTHGLRAITKYVV